MRSDGEPVYGALGALTRDQFQAALDRFDLGQLKGAWPLTDGVFGKNVAIDSSYGAWVLRGDPWPANSDVQLRREAFFAAAIEQRTEIAAPWPYFIESQPGVFPWPYALMKRFEGRVDLSDPKLDWPELARALGRGLAELHRISWPRPGEWQPRTNDVEAFAGDNVNWLRSRIASLLLTADLADVLDDVSRSFVLRMLDRASEDIESGGMETTYVHHDYKPTNVSLVQPAASQFALTGVFDLSEGYAGDPLEDLPRGLYYLITTHRRAAAVAFLSSYRDASRRAVRSERVLAYAIFDLLLVWEFGNRPSQRWFESEGSFAEWADPLIADIRHVLACI